MYTKHNWCCTHFWWHSATHSFWVGDSHFDCSTTVPELLLSFRMQCSCPKYNKKVRHQWDTLCYLWNINRRIKTKINFYYLRTLYLDVRLWVKNVFLREVPWTNYFWYPWKLCYKFSFSDLLKLIFPFFYFLEPESS